MLGLVALLLAADPVVLEGPVPDAGEFFLVPFEVPAGTVELRVLHDDLSSSNILDWGLLAPDGGFVGWGGGNSEPAEVSATQASRSYRPAKLEPGTWQVLVGKALVTQQPAKFHLEIETRSFSLQSPRLRTPYVDAPALKRGARWWAGDMHVHSTESGDARASLQAIADLAALRGLDFVALSEHNTLSTHDFLVDAQVSSPAVLLVPSVEFTTYAGHLNVFGVTALPRFWFGVDGASFDGAMNEFASQRGVPTINHPTLDLGTFCIGCAWQHPVDARFGAVEVGVGGWDETGSLFDESALAFWEAQAARGIHLAAVGGSDDHRAGEGRNQTQSALGSPTTLIFADELSVPALLAGLKNGRTVVKLRGPDDPMLELKWDQSLSHSGDTVLASELDVTAVVTGGDGATLAWVENGVTVREEKLSGARAESTFHLVAPEGNTARLRAEVRVDQQPRTVSSFVWLGTDASLPPAVSTRRSSSCATIEVLAWGAVVMLFRRRKVAPSPLERGEGRGEGPP
ncbi:MAG: CehA/McbA family metallohydrolase [Myxococcaceae bacterium]